MSFCKAATLDDLWSGEKLGLLLRGRRVLLVNVDGAVCAYEDRCLHKGIPLSEGRLMHRVLRCSAHGWDYDALTGKGLNPEGIALPVYPVRVDGDDILVDLPDEPAP